MQLTHTHMYVYIPLCYLLVVETMLIFRTAEIEVNGVRFTIDSEMVAVRQQQKVVHGESCHWCRCVCHAWLL